MFKCLFQIGICRHERRSIIFYHQRKYPEINLILITGQADKETLNALRNSMKVTAILNKPWDPKTLQSYIDSLILLMNHSIYSFHKLVNAKISLFSPK